MTETISSFRGQHRFLSNFYPCEVELDGVKYRTLEHAYQAAKSCNPKVRAAIRAAGSPGLARAMGRTVILRSDWEAAKVDIMLDLLRQKFAHSDLGGKLLATGGAYLVEENSWGDTFWGAVDGKGQNLLGTLLIVVRYELRGKLPAREQSPYRPALGEEPF